MLYPKQEEIYKQIKDGSLLHLGTGTGKTIISLIYYLNNHINKHLYIIAPAAKVHEGGWERELRMLCSKYFISLPKYTIVSYASLKKTNFGDGFYILDEAHYIKNPTAMRSKHVVKILKEQPFIMLTATPGSKIDDFANYFILWGFNKNKSDFYRTYIVQQLNTKYFGKMFMEVVSYKNQDKFNELLKSKSTSRLTVNDIVELPDIINKDIFFNASAEYKTVKKNRVITVNNSFELLDTQIKLCSTLRQIVSTKNKLEYVKFLRDNLGDENLIVFYNFNSEFELLKELLKPEYIINGKTKIYPKKEVFDKVKGSVTLVQIQAGGTEIELQYANQVVYFSPTYSYQEYEQSLGRAYRPGQDKKVIIYKFKTKDTIEMDVWKALESKEDFNEKLWN